MLKCLPSFHLADAPIHTTLQNFNVLPAAIPLHVANFNPRRLAVKLGSAAK